MAYPINGQEYKIMFDKMLSKDSVKMNADGFFQISTYDISWFYQKHKISIPISIT